MLEVETLGPVTSLAPGSSVTHTEVWSLTDGVSQPESEQDVLELVTPKVMAVLDARR
jgi:hypothetical protein